MLTILPLLLLGFGLSLFLGGDDDQPASNLVEPYGTGDDDVLVTDASPTDI